MNHMQRNLYSSSNSGLTASLLLLVVVVAGCNTVARIPAFRSAEISPPELMPGASALITAEVADRFKIVHRVEGALKEYPNKKLKLHDDGLPPDTKAGDGIWSLQVDVPFQAPPGAFILELTAYNSKGDVIIVPGPDGNDVPLMSTCKVVISYPQK